MKLTINPFDPKGIRDERKVLMKYKRDLSKKAKEFAEKLAAVGLTSAQMFFSSAVYDYLIGDGGVNVGYSPASIVVTSIQNSNSGKNYFSYRVSASGKEIAFIEFGAGVYFNSGGDAFHPQRPGKIYEIGEYGKGHGKQPAWGFYDEQGESHITRGTPEQPGMALAARDMKDKIEEIAREVFGT